MKDSSFLLGDSNIFANCINCDCWIN